ncbi:hypothetical protein KCH_75040 [Kitasatospora cheerisanensis KCTC 2395]|uniref:Uncharacterized protein n=1 Tax=Kitasatospora cheerisanensis KCTC 2395 TaxID=1348663 RepID=A0A066YLE7_9ACTN|nr:hypothetical protein KCH_75040 [Kitasatospora cheerisanensis KCTC 2395]
MCAQLADETGPVRAHGAREVPGGSATPKSAARHGVTVPLGSSAPATGQGRAAVLRRLARVPAGPLEAEVGGVGSGGSSSGGAG